MSKVFFITGANRGIGLALTKVLAADSSNVVIASARDPANATELNALTQKGNVHVVKLDVSLQESIDALNGQLGEVAGAGIDYFISNAGINNPPGPTTNFTVPREQWNNMWTTNTLGPIMISRVVYPFLLKKDTRVIYLVSSGLGSITGFQPISSSSYGLSKAALNYFAKSLSFELAGEGFTVVAMRPGIVSSDMGTAATEAIADPAVVAYLKKIMITPEESAKAQVEVLKKLTKEDNGKFLSYTGEEAPW